eukprot:350686-Chlamydomonas_euryale.AAC.3
MHREIHVTWHQNDSSAFMPGTSGVDAHAMRDACMRALCMIKRREEGAASRASLMHATLLPPHATSCHLMPPHATSCHLMQTYATAGTTPGKDTRCLSPLHWERDGARLGTLKYKKSSIANPSIPSMQTLAYPSIGRPHNKHSHAVNEKAINFLSTEAMDYPDSNFSEFNAIVRLTKNLVRRCADAASWLRRGFLGGPGE